MAKTVTISNDNLSNNHDEKEKTKSALNLISVEQTRNICEGYIIEIKQSQKYHEENNLAIKDLKETVTRMTKQKKQVGNADNFHNLSVLLGKSGFEDLACDVIECGLDRFPSNVDLLSDFLIYGIDCERLEECSRYFAKLEEISKSEWTWRCFAFGIVYMKRLGESIESCQEMRNKCRKKAMSLARAYKKYLPFEEGGYRETAKLMSRQPSEALHLLDEALENEEVGSCPTCALEKAEILFKQKKYVDTILAINRSLEDSVNQKQGGTQVYYLYFLRGLCRTGLISKKIQQGVEISEIEKEVRDIYSDFDKALVQIESGHKDTIKTRTQLLIDDTNVFPENMERLENLIDSY